MVSLHECAQHMLTIAGSMLLCSAGLFTVLLLLMLPFLQALADAAREAGLNF